MKTAYHILNDAELCRLLRQGAQHKNEAFAEMYRRHHQRIYAYIVKVTGDVDESADIFQETFVRFVRSVEESGMDVDNIGGFLMRTARNLCLNHKRDRKSTTPLEDFHLISPATQGYEQEELLGLIQTALECLEHDYREAFVMRLYHDLSYEEMAEITGTTVPTMKNRVWRAKDKIRTILAPVIADFDKL